MKTLLTLLIVLLTSTSYADCIGTIVDVKMDSQRGSIIVETQYVLNGINVQLGRTRYTETSGTRADIKAMISRDIDSHCEAIIQRMPAHDTFRRAKMLERQKELTQPIIDNIKSQVVGLILGQVVMFCS